MNKNGRHVKMKAIFIFMLAPIIPSLSNAQEFVISEKQQPIYKPGVKVDSALHGKVTYYYDSWNDQIKAERQLEVTYNNGVLDGPVRIWSNNYKLWCTGQFKDNKKTGKWNFYHPNGILWETGEYDIHQDSSFLKVDPLVEIFLTPSYFEYGIDTATVGEIMSAGIIPQFNIGLNRSDARIGTWKIYSKEGKFIRQKTYPKVSQ